MDDATRSDVHMNVLLALYRQAGAGRADGVRALALAEAAQFGGTEADADEALTYLQREGLLSVSGDAGGLAPLGVWVAERVTKALGRRTRLRPPL